MSSLPLQKIFNLIDEANEKDPRQETYDGKAFPKELLYGRQMTEMLQRFFPQASEVAQIAARAQHIERWKIPRSDYPMDLVGYKKWRTTLYEFHANRIAEILTQSGADAETIQKVKNAVSKKGIKSNPESQLVEDIAGLVFLEHYIADFAAQKSDYSEEKWIGIITKTWKKLSKEAQDFILAGKIKIPEHLKPLVLKALGF